MKSKRVLRFYFNAGALEKAIDNLILRSAYLSAGAEGGGERIAQKIIGLIGAKDKLGEFWRYLDGVAADMPEKDVEALRFYAGIKTGISGLPEAQKKAIKSALIKFTRRARGAGRHAEAAALVNEYYCLL